MKNLLALVGAVVVLVVGLGWYLNWFKFGAEKGTPGHPTINVEVETDKIKNDLKKGRESVGEFIKEHEGKVPDHPASLVLPKLPEPPPLPPPGTVPDGIVLPQLPALPPLEPSK